MSNATNNFDFGAEEFEGEYEVQVVSAAPGRRLIIRSTVIDSKNTKRERIVLTPSMCTRQGCRFDASSRFGGWENVPDNQRSVIADVLIQHDKVAHNFSEDLIVDEANLPTQWLGDDAKKKTLLAPIFENSTSNINNPRVVLK